MMRLPSIEEQASNEKRPLMVDTWKYRNKNYIMYVPDGKIEIKFWNHAVSSQNFNPLKPEVYVSNVQKLDSYLKTWHIHYKT